MTPAEAHEIAQDAYVFAFRLNYYYRTIYSQILDPKKPEEHRRLRSVAARHRSEAGMGFVQEDR